MSKPHCPASGLPSRRCASRQERPSRGFSLIELLVVVSVLGVLLAVAAPAVNSIGTSMKLSSFTNAFVSLMRTGRGEAIKRNGRVVMCKSASGILCASAGGWDQGWILFHDRNNNGVREADETLIGRMQALPQPYRMSGNLNVARYISFSPDGSTRLISGAFQAGTVTLCRLSVEPSEARQVIINAVGRARTQTVSVANCL